MHTVPQDDRVVNLNFCYPTINATKVAIRVLQTIAVCAIALLLPFAALGYTSFTRTKRYYVPGTENTDNPLTAAIGYLNEGVLRSVRSRGGRHYGGDTLNFLVAVLDAAESDGLDTAEIVITYKRIGTTVTYSTDIETLRKHGDLVMGVSGLELALPIAMWSIDGKPPATPTAQAQPVAAQPVVPVATQGALFDMPVVRKGGAY